MPFSPDLSPVPPLVLASASPIRQSLLTAAGLPIRVDPARIDEPGLRHAMTDAGAGPRDIAVALAEAKANRIANRHPGSIVIGADQILVQDGAMFGKADDLQTLRGQLIRLRGTRHALVTAVAASENGVVLWRHVETPQLTMRTFSDGFLDAYLERFGTQVLGCVGGYRFEAEGIRLFSHVEGDFHSILGLPLLPLLTWLTARGHLPE